VASEGLVRLSDPAEIAAIVERIRRKRSAA
jgi:hypothetical protein